jgi:hypothetical protein
LSKCDEATSADGTIETPSPLDTIHMIEAMKLTSLTILSSTRAAPATRSSVRRTP